MSPPRNQTTGLQVAHSGLAALLERWREQLSPRECTLLLEPPRAMARGRAEAE